MFIETRKIKTEYTRYSKNGKSHAYSRYKNVVVLKCDVCNTLFERDQGLMDRRRVSNDYRHVCSACNPKKFAQMVGVENRFFWNQSVDSDQII
jgi:hypothetical protein